LPYQIPTVSGKNQQFPGWYREFASLIEPQPNLSHVVFDKYRSPFFDVLNVRYVITHEFTATGDFAPPLSGYDLLAADEGVTLYENTKAMPRAFFAIETIEVPSHIEALRVLSSSDFDPHSTVVIEQATTAAASPQTGSVRVSNFNDRYSQLFSGMLLLAPATATIIDDKRNRVTIQTENGADGLLVLSDNYYPGWRAYVDGVAAEILRANCTMRAVKVPTGSHLVSFVFMPASFIASTYVSLGAAGLTLAALILLAFKRQRIVSIASAPRAYGERPAD